MCVHIIFLKKLKKYRSHKNEGPRQVLLLVMLKAGLGHTK